MATLAQELSSLVNAGLIIQPDVFWITSPTIPYGYVISINPVGGTTVALWTYVQVYVSLGPAVTTTTTTVPNLVGAQQYAAHQAIGAASLIWNVDLYASSSTVSPTFVISQTPASGTVVSRGTVVQITVSTGPATTPPTVVVPT